MDKALELRIATDNGQTCGSDHALSFLQDSNLVHELTAVFDKKPLFAVWRIIALSEIPYSAELDYTKQVIKYIEENLSSQDGFSLTGQRTDLLPCYNAMLVEALSKLGQAESPAVQQAVAWIKKYQPFERNADVLWDGVGVKKYGGCMRSTPCYIGVVKSIKALVAYDIAVSHQDKQIVSIIAAGMDYVLRHELFKRLSNKEPITKHILDLAFPASYQLNIVELLGLAYDTRRINEAACQSACDFLKRKRTKDGFWKINYVYQSDGYQSFDQRGNKAEWVTYLLNRYLAE